MSIARATDEAATAKIATARLFFEGSDFAQGNRRRRGHCKICSVPEELTGRWARPARPLPRRVRFAREAGYRRITLWTNSSLRSARRIYEAAGFRKVRAERHESFGHVLVGETWDLPLAGG